MARRLVPLVALVAAFAVVPSVSGAPSACGSVVTTNVVLTASLTGCADGLVVGADGITIDLNGYAIQGLGSSAGVGVDLGGHSGVTVRNGVVRGFSVGVQLVGTSRATVSGLTVRDAGTGVLVGHGAALAPADANTIRGNRIRDVATGIAVAGDGDRVDANRIERAAERGISIRSAGLAANRLVLSNNRVASSGTGIWQLGGSSTLLDNDVVDNAEDGIFLLETTATVARNRVLRNGRNGITGPDSHVLYRDNVTSDNVQSGLVFVDGFGEHGAFMEVTRHTANDNGGYGIYTNQLTVVDGGGNRARGNATAPQCVGVVCRIRG